MEAFGEGRGQKSWLAVDAMQQPSLHDSNF
jgi:hypothetical protein